MATKVKHAPSVLLTDAENNKVRDILGQKKYVSIYKWGKIDEFYSCSSFSQGRKVSKFAHQFSLGNFEEGVIIRSRIGQQELFFLRSQD